MLHEYVYVLNLQRLSFQPSTYSAVPDQDPRSVAAQPLNQTRLGCGQQLREHSEVRSSGGGHLQRSVHVDADHMPTRPQPQLPLARGKDAPGLVLLLADQRVLPVRAEPSVGSGLALGAGQAVVATASAVFGPSSGLEMPAAKGPDNDMDASR
jgi:hypothetical protein